MRATDLFDDYAARYARGERPDVREYLERAGGEADELSRLIDAYLQGAPVHEPAPETVLLMQALIEGEPPILRIRVGRRLTRDAVVDALVRGLKVSVKKRDKVELRYHELETGLLDPSRVDPRVLSVLAKTLKARVADLVALRPPPLAPKAAYLRADADLALDLSAAAPLAKRREEPDEVDRLFGVPG